MSNERIDGRCIDLATCAVNNCDRQVSARGWCVAHYRRWLKHGDVQAHIPIGLPRGGGRLPQVDIGYDGWHKRVRKLFGQPSLCEFCGSTDAKRFEWAQRHGTELSANREDWLRLCVSCHRKYDETPELREKITASLRGVKHTEEHNTKIRGSSRRTWSNPELRAQQSQRVKAIWDRRRAEGSEI